MTGLEGVGWILILGTLPWIVLGGVTAVPAPVGAWWLSKPLPRDAPVR